MQNKIATRFAPSPTGLLHLGSYRTAIFSYLYAKKNSGSFILRIEDTDKERNKKEYENNIIESLKWLGLNYDKFYRQSENVGRHKEYLEKMIAEGSAYISKEEAKDGSGEIKELIRFKNPNIDVTFKDEIKGEVTMNTKDLGDFVIAKNLNEPLFHLAVVADDFDEGVTHVIRGEDHTSNTPRQILIQKAIGAPTPIYAHLPLVLGPDKLKLSKRRGALPVTDYREMGFLSEAILNGTAFIGWNPGTDKEIFTFDELIKSFDFPRVQISPAVFNEEKLRWFNKEHMKRLPQEELEKKMIEWVPKSLESMSGFSMDMYKKIIPMIFERITAFGDIKKMADSGELNYFFRPSQYEKAKLNYKTCTNEKTKEHLEHVLKILIGIEDFTPENVKVEIMKYADGIGTRGEALHPVRYSLSGMDKSPDPFSLAGIFGKEETVSRLKIALELLSG